MRIRGILLLALVVSTLVVASTACAPAGGDDDDDGFGGATLVSIAITGGTTVGVGSSLQLTATGTFDDSSTANITASSVWTTSNAGIATVSATGLVTGVAPGATTITATRTGISGSSSMTVGSGVAPLQPITERFSFTNGTEIWLCFESQFDGSIVNISTDDDVGPACSDSKLGVAFASTPNEPQFHVLRLDHGGDGSLSCDTGIHEWHVDYLQTESRCSGGCDNAEYAFNLAANSPFGAFCGDSGLGSGSALITSFEGYKADTTGKLRLKALTGPIYPITFAEIRLYDAGDAFLATCTASATIEAGATGNAALFSADCNPDLDTLALVPGTTYNAMLLGTKAGPYDWYGYVALDFIASP